MALAQKIGKAKAHETVEAACNASRKDGKHLRDVVRDEASIGKHFSTEEIDGFFDAQQVFGNGRRVCRSSRCSEQINGLARKERHGVC